MTNSGTMSIVSPKIIVLKHKFPLKETKISRTNTNSCFTSQARNVQGESETSHHSGE